MVSLDTLNIQNGKIILKKYFRPRNQKHLSCPSVGKICRMTR